MKYYKDYLRAYVLTIENNKFILSLLYEAETIEEILTEYPLIEVYTKPKSRIFDEFVIEDKQVESFHLEPRFLNYRSDRYASEYWRTEPLREDEEITIYKDVYMNIIFVMNDWLADSIKAGTLWAMDSKGKYDYYDLIIQRGQE